MTKKLVSSQNEVDPQYSPIRRIIFRQNEVDPQYSPIRNFFLCQNEVDPQYSKTGMTIYNVLKVTKLEI